MSNRHETQIINSEYLHPDISYNASQASGRKKKKQPQEMQRAGSRGRLLNREETAFGDQDSGIVDGCISVSDDRNLRQRNRDKKVTSLLSVERILGHCVVHYRNDKHSV